MKKIILSVLFVLSGTSSFASDYNQDITYISWCGADQKIYSSTSEGEQIVLAECAETKNQDDQSVGVCKETQLISTKGRIHISAQCELQR